MSVQKKFSREEDADVLILCSYYYPYISGLTIIAMEIAEHLASFDLKVTVLCHQHDRNSDRDEVINNVRVVRARKLISLNRATLSFDYFIQFFKLISPKTKINMHLPLPESGLISLLTSNSIVSVYQCDVDNKNGVMKLVSKLMDLSSIIAFIRSDKVVFSSLDYAEHSRLYKFARRKLEIIPNFTKTKYFGKNIFRDGKGKHFGYLGRFTSEKGILILLQAFASLEDSSARLIIAGSTNVAGDSVVEEVIKLAKNDSRVTLLTDIDEVQKVNFFASIDVLCLPSTNSFEAFGIVQLEALFCGVPVIVSDLPGVRSIIKDNEYGLLVDPGSISSLKYALTNNSLRKPSQAEINELKNIYSAEIILNKYRLILS